MLLPVGAAVRPAFCREPALLLGSTVLLAVTSLAPGVIGAQSTPALMRDSAGVRIVESSAPMASGKVPRLGGRPELQVGEGLSGGAAAFGKVAGVLLLPDGGVVVADEHTGQVKVFDSQGRLRRSVGRTGEGPGEFRAFGTLQRLPGDSLLVYDPRLARVTVLDGGYTVARTEPIALGSVPGIGRVHRISDGTYLVTVASLGGPDGPRGYVDLEIDVRRYDPAARRLRPVARSPGRQLFRNPRGALVNAPVLRTASVAFHGDRVVLGNGASWMISEYAANGTLARSVRRGGIDLRLSEARYRRAEQAILARFSGDAGVAQRWRRAFGEVPRPDWVPAYRRIIAAPDGGLWVEKFTLEGEAPGGWSVFDPAGRYLGDTPVPAGFELLGVDEGRAYGVFRDEYGVEYVRVYALER